MPSRVKYGRLPLQFSYGTYGRREIEEPFRKIQGKRGLANDIIQYNGMDEYAYKNEKEIKIHRMGQ
jgi:hypothetical protein